MTIYSNENIRKITKLSPHEFPHLVKNGENICTRKLWHIQYVMNCICSVLVLVHELNLTHIWLNPGLWILAFVNGDLNTEAIVGKANVGFQQ